MVCKCGHRAGGHDGGDERKGLYHYDHDPADGHIPVRPRAGCMRDTLAVLKALRVALRRGEISWAEFEESVSDVFETI